MIACLTGRKLASLPTGIILDVNGVGYFLEMPLSSLCSLPKNNDPITLFTHTYVRQDIFRLFGFSNFQEKTAFEILISLNGVGPKVALAILSTLTLKGLKQAVLSESSKVFESVPGIGKRLAEKILVELKPKVTKLESSAQINYGNLGTTNSHIENLPTPILQEEPSNEGKDHHLLMEDAVSALSNLGFKEKVVSPVLRKLLEDNPDISFENLMKKSLVQFSGVKDTKEKPKGKAASPSDNLFESGLF